MSPCQQSGRISQDLSSCSRSAVPPGTPFAAHSEQFVLTVPPEPHFLTAAPRLLPHGAPSTRTRLRRVFMLAEAGPDDAGRCPAESNHVTHSPTKQECPDYLCPGFPARELFLDHLPSKNGTRLGPTDLHTSPRNCSESETPSTVRLSRSQAPVACRSWGWLGGEVSSLCGGAGTPRVFPPELTR